MIMNPYEVLGVDFDANFDEIDAHREVIIKELQSGNYDRIHVLSETFKVLAACNTLLTPHEKAIIDCFLSPEEKTNISKNADLFREALRTFQQLEDSTGREVIVTYICQDLVDFQKGKLKSVKKFDEIEVGRLHIPFISSNIVISKIVDTETNEVLYFNPNPIYRLRELNKREVLHLIEDSWGKGTAERQASSKKVLNISEEKSSSELKELFLKIKKLHEIEDSEGYIKFIEKNELSAAEVTLLTHYCGSEFRKYFDDENSSYTMKPRKQ